MTTTCFHLPGVGYWEVPKGMALPILPEGAFRVPVRPSPFATWDEENAAWIDNGPPPPTAEMIRAEGERRLLLLGSGYSSAERETWPSQVDEAEAFMADNTTPAPMLDALGAPRGLSTADMAVRVLSKRDQFNVASAAILAAQEALLNADPIPTDYADDGHWP